MRLIFSILLAFMMMLGSVFRSIMKALVNKSVEYHARVVGYVDSQVDSIRSVFARKPCSATGGSA